MPWPPLSIGRLQDFLWQTRELGVEVVEKGPPYVEDEPSFGLSKEFGVRVGHAPLVRTDRRASTMLALAFSGAVAQTTPTLSLRYPSTCHAGSTFGRQQPSSPETCSANHREDITMALYLDDRHRLVGTAILTIGWVQAARLSARPILFGTQACQSSACIRVRYRRYGAPSATEGEDRSFRTIAAACSRYGVVVAEHVIVVGWRRHRSAFRDGP
ncbi:MAG: JAB domain-containing protein [Acidimicrobiales bacterium]